MTTAGDNAPVLLAEHLGKTFRRKTGEVVRALDGVSIEAGHGRLTALVGPDGSGKTTLLRLAAGLMTADTGRMRVLGVDAAVDPQQIQVRVGYMPQRFGLYEDLTVQENLDLYADLHGLPRHERPERYARLMAMTALGPFTTRLAGKLSGGMKQKLGLACTLVRSPELLLLDEPTVGVDPLSRRELWSIILQLVHDQGLTVVLSTSYLDEAERCHHVVVLHEGKVLAQGRPEEVSAVAAGCTFLMEPSAGQSARLLQAQLLDDPQVVDAVPEGGRVRVVRAVREDKETRRGGEGEREDGGRKTEDGRQKTEDGRQKTEDGRQRTEDGGWKAEEAQGAVVPTAPRFEDGFMVLLRQKVAHRYAADSMTLHQAAASPGDDLVVQVRDLVRRFGRFTAVDHIKFDVRRGEVYGLLGPNGAGKTTTFRMLCGLLAASSGSLHVAGIDLRHGRASARQNIGYVAQKFSLYGQLSVAENLDFFANAYGLRGPRKRQRIAWAVEQFELASFARLPSGQLPGGYKQRLAMAAALLHEPQILFLDEPTSGADPLARREFWRRITAMAEQGVTVIVTTHFMEEAEYCDRVAIMDAGRVLAQGPPGELRGHGAGAAGARGTMEDAFIAIVEHARNGAAAHTPAGGRPGGGP